MNQESHEKELARMGYFSKIKKVFRQSKEIQASSAYVICSVVQRCLSFITLPLFTRLLTQDQFGIGTVYSSTYAVAIIFTTLHLPYGSFSPAMIKFEKDREGYISAVNTICILFTTIYFIIYFLFQSFWNNILDLPTELMILLGFDMLFSTSITFWMGKARFEYKYKTFVKVTLVTTVLGTLCALLAVVFLPNKGVAKVMANSFVMIAVGVVIMIMSLVRGKQCFNKKYWKYALSFNIPLIPYYLSQMVFNQSDRLMINKMTGRSDAAMYGVAYALAFILTFVLNAINNSFIPWLYRKIKEDRAQEARKITLIIALIMAVLLLGVIAMAPEIILIMAGEQYMPAIWVVPPVAMSLLLLFYSQLFINIEFYFEEKYKLVGASILAAVVNIVFNYFGIIEFGFVAAGYTTLISYILFVVCNYFAMKKLCKDRNIDGNIYNLKGLVLIFLVFSITGFGFMALYLFTLIRLTIIVIVLIVILIFRERIINSIKQLLNTIKR